MPIFKIYKEEQKGFVHFFLLIAVFGVVALVATSNIPVTFTPTQNPNVKGVLIAKGGDDSGGSSGGGDSSSHDSDSSSSSGGSGSRSSDNSGDSGKTENSSTTSPQSVKNSSVQSTREVKTSQSNVKMEKENEKVESKETNEENKTTKANKLENENEIENELENEEVKEVELKAKDGELDIEVKEASGSTRKLSQNHGPSQNKSKKVKLTLGLQTGSSSADLNEKREVEIEADGNVLKISSKGIAAETNFPLSIDKNTGQLVVQTGNGPKVIRILPHQASQITLAAGVQNQIEDIEITENTTPSSADTIEFKIKGVKLGSLLGFIPVNSSVETKIGAQTGNINQVTEPLWLRLLSPFMQDI